MPVMLDQKAQQFVVDLRLLLPQFVTGAVHLLAAVAILIVGFWLAGRVQILIVRALGRTPHLDTMLKGFSATSRATSC